MKKIKIIGALFLLLGILACSIYEPEPVGIGTDFSALKKSPCACLKIELAPELPEWVS